MNRLLTMLSLLMLSGCVTYYYPQTAIEDGVYYAEDDPAYINGAYVNYYYGYAGSAYYPWRSMDYFYFGYGYPYGYSPWHYPYYSYFSPWYYPHYHHGYRRHWRQGDYCQPYNACGRNKYADNGSGGDNPYPGRSRDFQQYGGGEDEDGNEDPSGRRNRGNTGKYGTDPIGRYVSTVPSGASAGGSSDQGMVIRNRGAAKAGRSRSGPVNPEPVVVTSLTPSMAQPDYRARRSSGEIRYRSGAKQGRSRTHSVGSDSRYSAAAGGSTASPALTIPAQSGGNFQSAQGQSKQGGATRASSGKASSATGSRPPAARSSRSRATSSSPPASRSGSSRSSGRSSGRARSSVSRQQK